jgi:membrane protein DedA with SNARE-associated domain/rhodanese-related sulfurtransferase
MNEAIQFLTEYGLLVLFAVVFIEQIGFPLPAFPVLIAAGVLAGMGRMNLWVALGGTVAVTLVADWIWFELGRRQGRRVLDVLCRIALEPDTCVRKTEDFFIKHGPHSLLAAKFIPGLSTVAPSLAGIVGLGTPIFLLYDGLGAMIWAGSGLVIGSVFSDQLEQAVAYVETGCADGDRCGPCRGPVLHSVQGPSWRRRQLLGVPRVTIEQLTDKLLAAEPPLLIDVRSRASAEAETGDPERRLDVAGTNWFAAILNCPRHRDVVLYCGCPKRSCERSGRAAVAQAGIHAGVAAGRRD